MTKSRGMMRARPRRLLPVDEWPEIDRQGWREALRKGDVLEPGGAAAAWAPATRALSVSAYGGLLTWLAATGRLDPRLGPAARVTRPVIAEYVAFLKDRYAPKSVASYVAYMVCALKAMAPDHDWRWLQRAATRLNRIAMPLRNKRALVVPAWQLYALGQDLMAEADATFAQTPGASEAVQYRNGLIIALLASRPLRRRNLVAIEIGTHLVPSGAGYGLRFGGHETKNRRDLEMPFPDALVPSLERYLSHYRPWLLTQTARHSASTPFRAPGARLWITGTGSAMSPDSLHWAVSTLTAAKFGHPIHPHLFRDCVATSIAEDDPEHIGITRSLLGHARLSTSEAHYTHAKTTEAYRRYQDAVAALRNDG